jgi:NADH:ubiquinone oxidoreductase subunit E
MAENTTDFLKDVHAVIKKYGTSRDEIIPVLLELNNLIGYIPKQVMVALSEIFQVPKSQLFSNVTFYHLLSTNPRGRHTIQFCESAPCHVSGGRDVWTTLQEELGLKPGETSLDNKWSLLTTSCIGMCDLGPFVVVDGDIYANVTPAQIPDILAKFS